MKAIKNRISSKLILILLALIFIIPKAVSQDRLADSTALVAIYQSTNGSGWTNKTGWEIIDGVGSPTPINSWHGVTLTTDRVSGLDLSSNNLGGTLPIEIGDLTALGTLDLAINLISGSVPTTIGALTALSDMNLLGNSFSGTIPTAINSLVNLTSIQLQSNQFTGTIPDFSSLTGLTNFAVSSNNLTGQIPEYLGSLQSLNQLFLSGNQLTGNVPDTLGTLLDLTFLRLDNNQLSDSIPSNFVNLTNLSNLLIHNNEFTHLPDLSTLGSFSTFNVSNNFFTFEDLEVNSSVITLNSSQKNFGSVQNLDFIVGDPISLDAFIPGTGANDTYQWLLNGADIAGATNQTYSKTAELVDAGSYSLRVSNSLFVGADIFSEDIVVNVNPIPINETDSLALVALYNSTNGASWTDNTNWLSGTLDTWVGVTVIDGRVTNLNLQSNEIQGSIPSEIGDLDSLKTISMSSFSGFGGILPSEIGNLSALTTLSLEGDFTGTIPTEIGNLSNLQTFNFYSDLIEGSYPASFGNLTSLTSLDFFGNNMSGSLPAEFSNLINLTRLRITVPEGNIPSYLGDLSSLQILYLTGANDPSLFNGTIPANLGNLTNLSSLTIRNSSVSGTIPVELGSLTSLGTLSLDTNQLSGSIPTEIGSLSGLSTLSFSNNSLTGDVPASFTGLTSLTELELQNNTLTSLPDLSGITSITYFDLGNNYLTFEDLEPNASIITQDASQLLFGSPQNISLP
ncbi:MAG: leucine-rich repeat domain-containing protein, partial [Ekhidna sp.]